MTDRTPLNKDEEWRYAREAMTWYGWGSPVGLGVALVAIGIAALLIRLAIVGF